MPRKKPDPKRTPARLADAFEPALLKQKVWTRSTGMNLICESKEEAAALVVELKSRGWKAKPDIGINLKSGKGVHYVFVSGRSTRKRRSEQDA